MCSIFALLLKATGKSRRGFAEYSSYPVPPSLRVALDGFGLKGRLVCARSAPASLMWFWLMTITEGRFGFAAASNSVSCTEILILLPLSLSRQIIRYRPSGGPQAVLVGPYTNRMSAHRPYFFGLFCLYISLRLPLCVPFGLY